MTWKPCFILRAIHELSLFVIAGETDFWLAPGIVSIIGLVMINTRDYNSIELNWEA